MPGRAAGSGGSLRLGVEKALFFRRGAQTLCREEPPAAVWVCALESGKPYSSVEGRKLFAGKSPRRPRGFAPHTRESHILPLRGANQLPGRAAGDRGGLRLIPGKALFFRREAQTNCREEAPAAMRVCASHPGKPYSSVERRKLIAGKSHRRPRGFAPHTRESLILPLRGANQLSGKGAGGGEGLRLTPGKALFFRRGAQTGFPGAGAELVHGTPQGLDFPFPLHQVIGFFRRLAPTFWLFTKKLRDRLIPIPQIFAKKLFFSLVLFKFYSAGLSGWISGIISTSRSR